MRTVQSYLGRQGCRHQLDRTRRFLARTQDPQLRDVDFQDMIWAVFLNCYHIRDWVREDPRLTKEQKSALNDKANASALLAMCGDLCNGIKHSVADRKPTRHGYVETIFPTGSHEAESIDCIVTAGGEHLSGKKLAAQFVAEWERILQSEGVATGRLS